MTRRRIQERFAKTKAENRAALVTFIMGGDPDISASEAVLAALPEAGADIIEIGMPFSDPMADGPTIQAAGLRALESGATLKHILLMVSRFRTKDPATPIILMGYYNPIYHYGIADFCADASQAGADGLIIVDLPPEEEAEFKPQAARAGLALIRLIAPTSLETRLSLLTREAEGFIYYISVAGITGAKSASAPALHNQVNALRSYTKLPIAVGFGVKTPAQAAEIAQFADAVVVGSALVEVIARAKNPAKDAAAFVEKLAAGLAK